MIKMLGGNIVIEGELWLIHRKGAAEMDYHYWPTPMMMLRWKIKMEKHWCLSRKGADEMDICPTSMTLKYLQVLSKLRITRDIYSHINIIKFAYINIYSLPVVLRLDVCCWPSWGDIKRAKKCFLVHCFHFHFKKLIINLYLSYPFSIWTLLAP